MISLGWGRQRERGWGSLLGQTTRKFPGKGKEFPVSQRGPQAQAGVGYEDPSGCCGWNGLELHSNVQERSRVFSATAMGTVGYLKTSFEDTTCPLCFSHGGTQVLRCVIKMKR